MAGVTADSDRGQSIPEKRFLTSKLHVKQLTGFGIGCLCVYGLQYSSTVHDQRPPRCNISSTFEITISFPPLFRLNLYFVKIQLITPGGMQNETSLELRRGSSTLCELNQRLPRQSFSLPARFGEIF